MVEKSLKNTGVQSTTNTPCGHSEKTWHAMREFSVGVIRCSSLINVPMFDARPLHYTFDKQLCSESSGTFYID